MTEAPLTLRRWKRAEYDRLIDLGVFEGDNIELIGGQLVVAEPKGAYHSSAVSTAEYALRAVLPPGWIVRTQAAISLDDESEPDLVVARAGTQDYWIVNLVDRAVEVYRDPAADPSAIYGWHYRSVTALTLRDVVSPLAFASIRILDADLLP
jgi:Uma2 family endonuclease